MSSIESNSAVFCASTFAVRLVIKIPPIASCILYHSPDSEVSFHCRVVHREFHSCNAVDKAQS